MDSKDAEGQKDGRKVSRDWDWSELRERERRGKRKWNESLNNSEDSDESDKLEYWSKKKADRRGRRRSRS